MAEFLAAITESVRGQLEGRKRQMPLRALRERRLFNEPVRGLAQALKGTTRRIIAEVKRASPSKGLIRQDFDPVAIAKNYAANGASAISVLTEERFFQGSLNYLEQIHDAVLVPLLRKDFIIDPYQVIEAKSYGADAILLIAALLDGQTMMALHQQATELSLDVLVEVHNEVELDVALEAGAQLVGINNRDLTTFKVSLTTTERLAPRLPAGVIAVCESGIDSPAQIRYVEGLAIHVFLIGEALMRAPQPGKKLSQLLQS